ncbi:hypothetical protein LCGC14_2208600 [marine sediment metagenome]|uniref:Uncharacterized protein n=1 Tax=marine sediment metagenome TaxID=412755 RepID=A0A0F9FRU3_9ZZZZ
MVTKMSTREALSLTPQEVWDREKSWSVYRDNHVRVWQAASGRCYGHTLYTLVTFDEMKRPTTVDCCTTCEPEQAEAFREVTDLRTRSIG